MEICNGVDNFVEIKQAFKGISKTYYLKNNCGSVKDTCLFLKSNKHKIIALLESLLNEHGALKFNIVLECT